MHYYEYFLWLCKMRNISESKASKELDINKSSVSRWRTAFAQGKEMSFSRKAAVALSEYFHVPLENILNMQDERGLTADDWAAMGTLFHAERASRGIPVENAVDGAAVTAEQLSDFEKNGTPLTLQQMDTVCGLIGTTAPDTFAAWADRLYGRKNKPSPEGERFNDDSIGYAAHQYDGDLTQRDKRLVVTFIKTLAEENRKNRKDGAT